MGEPHTYKVYLASPFFNEEQVERIAFVEDILKKNGYKVFSPRNEFVVKPNATKEDRKKGFEGNCKAITDCDFVLSITDSKDMGTIWESGYAFAKCKPVLYFAETLGNNSFNLMLAESGLLGICKSREELDHVLRDITTYSHLERYIYCGDKCKFEGDIE